MNNKKGHLKFWIGVVVFSLLASIAVIATADHLFHKFIGA